MDNVKDVSAIRKSIKKPQSLNQSNLTDRRKGAIEVSTQMLSFFLFFKKAGFLQEEALPYFKNFLKQRSKDARYYMTYYDKAVILMSDKLLEEWNKGFGESKEESI